MDKIGIVSESSASCFFEETEDILESFVAVIVEKRSEDGLFEGSFVEAEHGRKFGFVLFDLMLN